MTSNEQFSNEINDSDMFHTSFYLVVRTECLNDFFQKSMFSDHVMSGLL